MSERRAPVFVDVRANTRSDLASRVEAVRQLFYGLLELRTVAEPGFASMRRGAAWRTRLRYLPELTEAPRVLWLADMCRALRYATLDARKLPGATPERPTGAA